MCCFSAAVNSVSNTKIFARLLTRQDQALVYQMRLDTPTEVAIILPIPTVPGSAEDALRFVDLSGYPDFFKDLRAGFPVLRSWKPSDSPGKVAPKPSPLAVHQVGSFEASFVPKATDFSRLDPRFRLPDSTWKKLPTFANYSFAVFKLKKGAQTVHPMAFSFPSRLAAQAQLFFPTVHIHDGQVHRKEKFDHDLYAQAWDNAALRSVEGWRESEQLASQFTKVAKAQKLIWGGGHVYRRSIIGRHDNRDVIAQPVAIGA